jgi:hypothetical protein
MFGQWEEHADELLEMYPEFANGDFRTDDRIVIQDSVSYLILGIATLFVVIEFLRDHFVCFPDSVRPDIEALYPKMREFRNCVFHTQGTLLSKRQYALLKHPDCLLILGKIFHAVDHLLGPMVEELPDNGTQTPHAS